MTRTRLVRIAATLSLITCAGHAVGTLMAVPPDQIGMHNTIATMKATMVPMPVGSARSYMQILNGNNICTVVLLLHCAILLFAVASLPGSVATNRVLMFIAAALAAFAVVSVIYFYPLPAAFTGMAAVLTVIARSRVSHSARQP